MRTVFDAQLAEIHRDFLQLGRMVNEAIYKSVKGFVNHDIELCKQIIEDDLVINRKETDIDRKSNEVIALQQPNARDLRRVIAVIRASSNLERMADHAQNIAESTINIKDAKHNEELEAIIEEMGEKVVKMSSDIIDAFVQFDVEAAENIAASDIDIDILYNKLRFHAVEWMKKNPENVLAASDYSFMGRDLERIGDYVTNIAEGIVYLHTGEIVDFN
jgi:phosphate transport system protein